MTDKKPGKGGDTVREIVFRNASERDISFVGETYEQNQEKLHGVTRNRDDWKRLLENPDVAYYIVETVEPVAWFSVEAEMDVLWLAMLQIHPKFQRQGFGKRVLSFVESLAKTNGIGTVGIHTTEDNIPAQALYRSAGYEVSEFGKCTTADGAERMGYTFLKTV